MKLTRDHNVLTHRNTMEDVYTIPNMPVYFGCVDFDESEDLFLDQIFSLCKETGMIQIRDFPPADLLYLTRHNDSIGGVWNSLFESILSVVCRELSQIYRPRILEVGGGSGKLAEKILNSLDIKEYVLYEPNPPDDLFSNHPQLRIIKEYYRENISSKNTYDLILHSHVIEHVESPTQFMENISKCVGPDSVHIFVIPNLKETFSRKYTNALNFEHTFFMTEDYTDLLLNNTNMEILSKEYFLDHSIIYVTKRNESLTPKSIPNFYMEHEVLLREFISYHENFVNFVNEKMMNFKGNIFLFGAHIFSQYLIGFGLDPGRISCILDNSPLKIGKRLYGTSLFVDHPSSIKDIDCAVILKVATYQEEIRAQLLKINPNVVIIE